MRAEMDPEAPSGMPRKYPPNCGIRQCTAFRTHPKRRAADVKIDSGPHEVSVFAEIWQQQRGDLELDRDTGFGLGPRDQDRVLCVAERQVANGVERSKILATHRSKGRQGNHQPVSILNGIGQPQLRPELRPYLVHQLLPELED